MSYQAVRAVLDRSEAKSLARLLLLVLAEHLNESTRRCDPSIATLARECNTSRRTIPRLLAQLKAAGEIKIHAGGGRNHCNSYTITVAENPDTRVTASAANPDTSVTVSTSETLTPVSPIKGETVTNQVRNPDTRVTRTIRNQKDISLTADDTDFAAFWSAYPRKVAKAAAAKAWRSCMNRPPMVELLAALGKQKTSEQWQSVRFIPHPATWINQQRWEDELPPAEKPKPLLVRL